MSKRKLLASVAAIALWAAGTLGAQEPIGDPNLSYGPNARPFGYPPEAVPQEYYDDYFDYDAQMWAPFDVTAMDGTVGPQVGFYFAYDKATLSWSRPGPQRDADPRDFSTGSDYHWGSRYEFGWMGESDKGWNFGWLNMEGGIFTNGQDSLVSQPMMVRTNLDTFEINRSFRQALDHCDFLEPYIGVRYLSLNDDSIQDVNLGASTDRFKQKVTNSAIGGQIGGRYFRHRGRWRFSVDSALAACYNSQSYFSTDLTFANATGGLTAIAETTNEGQEFVPQVDVAMDIAYSVSRDFSVRVGAALLYSWTGIARADTRDATINPNSVLFPPVPSDIFSEDFIAAGVTFGVDWKR